jgi:hypothetical protein
VPAPVNLSGRQTVAASIGRIGMARIAKTLAAIALVVSATGVAVVTAAAPAQAVAAPFIESAVTVNDGTSPKSISVSCPAGTRVYGVAAQINGAQGAATLDDLTPNVGLTSVFITAYENGDPGDWALIGRAYCGSPTANIQRVTITSASNSVSPKSVTVSCPAGLRLYGLGGELTGAVGNVFFDDLTPNAGLTNAFITAYENGAYASNWSLSGYAICASPAATMLRVSSTTASDSTSPKDTSATCPTGTRTHGVGAELTGAVGNAVIDGFGPIGGTTLFGSIDAYEHGEFSGNWSATAYGICSS